MLLHNIQENVKNSSNMEFHTAFKNKFYSMKKFGIILLLVLFFGNTKAQEYLLKSPDQKLTATIDDQVMVEFYEAVARITPKN